MNLFKIFIIFFSLCIYAQNESWPFWRGAGRDGISQESQWEISLTSEVKPLWQKEIGNGHSSIVIQGNYLYTMGNIKNKDIVYCLDTKTGEEVWKYQYACPGGSFPGPRATPALDSDCVYTFSRNGHIFCLEAKTGKEIWKRNVTEEWEATNLMHGLSSSPCIIGDIVIVNAGAYGFAFHKKTGEKIWNSDPKIDCGYATPIPMKWKDKDYVLMFSGDGLSLVESFSGKRIYFFPWKTEYALNAADPVVIGDKIFISSWNEKGSALLEIKDNNFSALWQSEGMKNLFCTPIVLDGYLYGFNGVTDTPSRLKCIELMTGKEIWSKDSVYGTIIAVDKSLLILNEKGTLFIAKASPEGYQEISQCIIFKNARGMKAWTLPVFCKGILYFRNSLGNLLAFGLKEKKSPH